MRGLPHRPGGPTRDPHATVTAYDGTVFPDPYGPAARDDSWLARWAREAAELLAQTPVGRYAQRIKELTRFVRRGPSIHAGGREFFGHTGLGSRPEIRVRDADGTRTLVPDHTPSIVFPDVYPNAWWPSPDGTMLAHVQITNATEADGVLHIVPTGRTEDGRPPEPAFRTGGAKDAAFAWVGSDFVFSTQDVPPGRPRLWLVRSGPDGFGAPEPLPAIREDSSRSRFELHQVPGSRQVIVSSADYSKSQPNRIAVLNVDSGHQRVVQEETDVLTEVSVDAQGKWAYLLEYGGDGDRRGSVSRVRVDGAGDVGREAWEPVVPEQQSAVLKRMQLVDRGPDQEPVLAVHEREHAVSRLFMQDMGDGSRWRVPIPGTPVEGGDGVHGAMFAMSSDRDTDGRPALTFEFSEIATPPRLFTVGVRPGDAPRLSHGLSDEDLAGMGWPQVTTRLHRIPDADQDGTPTWALESSRSDVAIGDRPAFLEVYSGFFLAGERAYGANRLALIEAGATFVSALPRDGSEGKRDQENGAGPGRDRAASAVVATARYTREHITGDKPLTMRAGSQGPLVGLMALRRAPELFDGAVLSRGGTDPLGAPANDLSSGEFFGAGGPREVEAAYRDGAGYHEKPGTPYPPMVFVADTVDRRVSAEAVRKAHAAVRDNSTAPTYLLVANEGHFPGASEVATTTAVTARLLELPDEPDPERGTGEARMLVRQPKQQLDAPAESAEPAAQEQQPTPRTPGTTGAKQSSQSSQSSQVLQTKRIPRTQQEPQTTPKSQEPQRPLKNQAPQAPQTPQAGPVAPTGPSHPKALSQPPPSDHPTALGSRPAPERGLGLERRLGLG